MSGPGSVLHHALHRHLQEGGPPHRLFRCPATRGGHRIIIIIIFFLSIYCIQHCFICRPSDSIVSQDAGIEPRTLATSALAVRRSNHYIGQISTTTRLDLIHNQARSHPLRARSHSLLGQISSTTIGQISPHPGLLQCRSGGHKEMSSIWGGQQRLAYQRYIREKETEFGGCGLSLANYTVQLSEPN